MKKREEKRRRKKKKTEIITLNSKNLQFSSKKYMKYSVVSKVIKKFLKIISCAELLFC